MELRIARARKVPAVGRPNAFTGIPGTIGEVFTPFNQRARMSVGTAQSR